jgi:glycosyltransferase involved in cell wall biosynthesis
MAIESAGVSVVISTYNRPGRVATLVRQLLLQEDVPVPVEILVVNDHGSPEVYDIVRGVPEFGRLPVRFFDTGFSGFGLVLARNTGLRFARYPLTVFLDDDVTVARNFLATYLAAPEGPRAGRIDLVDPDTGAESPDRRGALMEGPARRLEDWRQTRGCIWGGNFCMPTDLGLFLGGFDERYLNECEEDYDFSVRVVLASRALVVVPGALARHHARVGPPTRISRVAERMTNLKTLVVNGGLRYWTDPRWQTMVVA